jgi:ComF family protein
VQPPCLLCGHHPHYRHNICKACLEDLPWAQPPIVNQTLGYAYSACALNYLPPINGLIKQFKHQRNLAAGCLLEYCLSKTISSALLEQQLLLPQLLIPVPLHRTRLRHRGFNQAEFIAHGLSKHLHIPMCKNLCLRLGDQAPLQGQNRRQRLRHMQGVFEVNTKEVNSRLHSIAIVDDVTTTGATAQALSSCLQSAWPNPLHIQLWCLARTPAPKTQLEW